MKKIFYCLMAATAAFAGSCTNEENVNNPQSDGTVSFQVSLPVNLGTRAYGDGTTATTLHYYVYDNSKGATAEPIVSKTETLTGKSADIEIQLVKGKTYSIAFWADAGNTNIYSYNTAARTITVNYTGANAQDENRDAFYKYLTGVKVETANNTEVVLTRPFAQVNIGASDIEEAKNSGLTITQTGLKVKGTLGTTLNLTNGAVTTSTTPQEFTFAKADIPADAEIFPYTETGVTYKYISMNYILVGKDSTIDVTLTAGDDTNSTDITYTSIPVKCNYQTNIYGSLLTNPATFKVTINPDFNTPDENVPMNNTGN